MAANLVNISLPTNISYQFDKEIITVIVVVSLYTIVICHFPCSATPAGLKLKIVPAIKRDDS
jgi:hypothetical protein